MIIYHNTKDSFINDVRNGIIADKLEDEFKKHDISHNNRAEHRAWVNSLHFMKDVLDDKEIDGDCELAIEYKIPLTSKRVDFLIAGKDENNQTNIVVIELKQREDAEQTELKDTVYTYVGQKMRYVTHPSYQAYSYAKTIQNFNETVNNYDVSLEPCAYLHNFEEKNRTHIDNEFYKEAIDLAPIFLQRDSLKLTNFIKKYIKKKDGENILFKIDSGKLKPSKNLQDSLGLMLRGNKEFELIDEQKVAYEVILQRLHESFKNSRNLSEKPQKYTFIIQGGPGTGKSVIAVSLLCTLIQEGYSAAYVSKNSAPRNVYFKKLRKDKFNLNYLKSLFIGSGSFVNAKLNLFDCLLCDEAHRLAKKAYRYNGKNQILDIIHASLISVFFIDAHQRVTVYDSGSIEEIKKAAEIEHSIIVHDDSFNLTSQFRCNGSDGYLNFLDNLLEIEKTENYTFDKNFDYELRLFNSPSKMREELRKKNINNKARMLAGYCYNWESQNKEKRSFMDINLEDNFHAQWNFNNTDTWIIDEDSFEQVGCIHTCQGLELDYAGVIIAKDLRFVNGKVITDYKQKASTNRAFFGLGNYEKSEGEAIADSIVRNTYRVLLSRAQKGTYIYCEDKALLKHISDMTGVPIEY